MVLGSSPRRGPIDLGLGGPAPPDVLALLGIVFLTYSLDAFRATGAVLELLRLGPEIWSGGQVWRLATYPFISRYGSPLGLLLALWMLFVFGKQIFYVVGRRAFWRSIVLSSLVGGIVAAAVQWAVEAGGWGVPGVRPFQLMGAQWVLLSILITAFAVFFSGATIYLFFVVPIKAGWFIGLEVLFAFLAFLGYRDFAGFVGTVTVIGVAYFVFSGRSPRRFLHEMRLRVERRILEAKMRRLRRKSGDGDDGVVRGPWVH